MSLEVWTHAASRLGCASLHPGAWKDKEKSSNIVATMVNRALPNHRKAIKTMVILILSKIWKERNDCTFRNKHADLQNMKNAITRTINFWRQAGATLLEPPFWDPPWNVAPCNLPPFFVFFLFHPWSSDQVHILLSPHCYLLLINICQSWAGSLKKKEPHTRSVDTLSMSVGCCPLWFHFQQKSELRMSVDTLSSTYIWRRKIVMNDIVC